MLFLNFNYSTKTDCASLYPLPFIQSRSAAVACKARLSRCRCLKLQFLAPPGGSGVIPRPDEMLYIVSLVHIWMFILTFRELHPKYVVFLFCFFNWRHDEVKRKADVCFGFCPLRQEGRSTWTFKTFSSLRSSAAIPTWSKTITDGYWSSCSTGYTNMQTTT